MVMNDKSYCFIESKKKYTYFNNYTSNELKTRIRIFFYRFIKK